MTRQIKAIVFYNLDLVATQALVGTSMKIPCVLISFNGCPNFTPLFPVSQFSLRDTAQDADYNGTKVEFRCRKKAYFLDVIQNVNNLLAVRLLLRNAGPIFSPRSEFSSGILQLGRDASSRVGALTLGSPDTGD